MDKGKLYTAIKVLAIPTAYAVLLRYLFGIDGWKELFSVMSVTFLFCLPTIVGALAVYLSNVEQVRKLPYRVFVPWIPVYAFMFITLGFNVEGWACWVMALPLFMITSSIGGLIGGYYKLRKKDNRVYVSVLVLIPFFISPIENMAGSIPGRYEANTYIDIRSTPEKIWRNVTRVREIPANEDKGWLTRELGFPRPVRAELNYDGVGAHREAVFTNGLVFHESVLEYTDQKKMVFTITAHPYEIPSTTMDSHVVIGGDYFDVLNGTYELEHLHDDLYRLHLYSHFKLTTTFNFYASWWAGMIMKDIQNNILQVVKNRAEKRS